ncbi:glucoamylase family protein [Limibacterium fermenti]|jgi:hypothetical protein|uniref:glucoamylase family protein n=1 Tax=Limibacterium fermenti TaxID=3229863 RepID=UPI000E906830|nr:beta-glucosidase [Porphyromonadaceae bacterium]HBX21804.1 beta-glucosidase [Porphyromonadaceae bacterium]HBX46755.1 beta-glucosidase [Porphyromonadaceae bacterium]
MTKNNRILTSLFIAVLITGTIFTACTNKQTKQTALPAGERPSSFASDDALLEYIQKAHFNYMWDGAEPTSGLARERFHVDGVYPENDADVVTTGGSGFGIAGLIVAIDRGFIGREEGVERLHKIADYLAKADRFHGVWPHWMHGPTGKAKAFSHKDDGGDLVESAFLMQGLLCAREYFKNGNDAEQSLAKKIDTLWREMDWTWYLDGQDVLYWHWSPTHGWEMKFPIEGYNECLITYILAAASPTHSIPASAYHNGWARGGNIKSEVVTYGHPLVLKHNGAEQYGGPLFWAHYSFIGLNPKGLKDEYADYWQLNRSHALINYEYCLENPHGYKGYSDSCWGLTASYSVNGYSAHMPTNDAGVITPTASLSSFPYTPEQSMRALKYFYHDLGDQLWGEYGFYDAFSIQDDWFPQRYLAIDQLTIAPMIENYRTGLLWNLFMGAPEIQEGLEKLGFKIQ